MRNAQKRQLPLIRRPFEIIIHQPLIYVKKRTAGLTSRLFRLRAGDATGRSADWHHRRFLCIFKENPAVNVIARAPERGREGSPLKHPASDRPSRSALAVTPASPDVGRIKQILDADNVHCVMVLTHTLSQARVSTFVIFMALGGQAPEEGGLIANVAVVIVRRC